MIKGRPLYGYGYGGFQANYMDEQAQFFRTHPNSRYAQLADDVKSPFNEYLGVLTEFGFRRYGHASLCRRAFPYVAETSWGKFATGSALSDNHCRLFPVLLPIPLSAHVDTVYGFRPCFGT